MDVLDTFWPTPGFISYVGVKRMILESGYVKRDFVRLVCNLTNNTAINNHIPTTTNHTLTRLMSQPLYHFFVIDSHSLLAR